MTRPPLPTGAEVIRDGRAVLGVEFGSTRIKAVLIDPDGHLLARGGHTWENRYEDQTWTYTEQDIWSGLQAAYASMAADAEDRHGARPTSLAALGVSAMMHGYLAFDASDQLLAPFRTWRNTSTAEAASALTEVLQTNIPLRWSVAHFYQAILDDEHHVARVVSLTTLAGHVHRRLTGRRVLGVGDASGMFPIDTVTRTYDAERLRRFDALIAERGLEVHLGDLLPAVLTAGDDAGSLTEAGAALLDPTGTLRPGAPLCPPEGDAGTGMVASNAVAPRSGNVSVGTSIFAMAVLEQELSRVHPELDVVTTPVGDPVAMIHCNNGADELNAWAGLFQDLLEAVGQPVDRDAVFQAMLREAAAASPDAGGLLAYNFLSGEPITGVADGRPLLLRTPGSRLSLGELVRAQVFAAFATLALGMRVLGDEHVDIDILVAHGGLFRTEGVAQGLLAAALDTPVAVDEGASEGGAWGIAVLASYLRHADRLTLQTYLDTRVFSRSTRRVIDPAEGDVRGFRAFLERYVRGLAIARAAGDAS